MTTDYDTFSIEELEVKGNELQAQADAIRDERAKLQAALSKKLQENRLRGILESAGIDAVAAVNVLSLMGSAQKA
jgi:hypothetical protein